MIKQIINKIKRKVHVMDEYRDKLNEDPVSMYKSTDSGIEEMNDCYDVNGRYYRITRFRASESSYFFALQSALNTHLFFNRLHNEDFLTRFVAYDVDSATSKYDGELFIVSEVNMSVWHVDEQDAKNDYNQLLIDKMV